MKKWVFQTPGFIFSLPMALTLLALTYGNIFDNQLWLLWFLFLFVICLPWSIPIGAAGSMAIFAASYEWWGAPLWYASATLAVFFSHINGGFLSRIWSRKTEE
jgi:hypothetical protein